MPATSAMTVPAPDQGVTYHPLGAQPAPDLDFEEWLEHMTQLNYIHSHIQWWLADLMNFGEQKWGQMYAQALTITDYTLGYLQNIKYVGSRVEYSRRREKLTFSHHQEVAHLPSAGQEYWLDMAEQQGWSVKRLRQAIRARQSVYDGQMAYRAICHHIDLMAEKYPAGLASVGAYLLAKQEELTNE